MANQFKEGDVVQLKSGSPMMTVVSVEESRIVCMWYEGSQRHQDEFKPEWLTAGGPSFA